MKTPVHTAYIDVQNVHTKLGQNELAIAVSKGSKNFVGHLEVHSVDCNLATNQSPLERP